MFADDDKPWIIFDYDDTLGGVKFHREGPDAPVRMCADIYQDVLNRFATYLAALHGVPREKTLETQLDIDMRLCEEYGFGDKARFPNSLVKTAEELVPEHNHWTDQNYIRALGWEVFTGVDYVPLPGALEVLTALKPFYRIAVLTKGDQEEQRKKAVDSGIMEFTDAFFSVHKKRMVEWEDVLSDLGIDNYYARRRTWAIGNSLKGDVNIPLRAGLNAIHVTSRSWAFEDEDEYEPHHGLGQDLFVVEEISDVLQHLLVRARA